MARFPYVQSAASLKSLLAKIPSVGKPQKVDATYLASIGVKQWSVRGILATLKSLSLIDSSGGPSERWTAYRDSNRAPIVMGSVIREVYSEVFAIYDDAHLRDDETLANLFSTKTGLGERTVGYMVRTFKTLCEVADFARAEGAQPFPEAPVTITVEPEPTKKAPERELQPVVRGREGLTINVNIQLTLPSDIEDHDLYDRFFASLKKHLLT